MSVANVSSDPFAYLDQAYPGANNDVQYRAEKTADVSENPDAAKEDIALFGKDGFGFDDFLDIINPLQHIPVISNLYREFTGDELSPGARMIGGGIFGGGIGLASSIINVAVEAETGNDIGGHIIGMFTDDDDDTSPAETIATLTKDGASKPEIATSPAVSPLVPALFNRSEKATPIIPLNASPRTEAIAPKLSTGLEWKGQSPDLANDIKQLESLQKKNLSDAQMGEIFKAFGKPAPNASLIPDNAVNQTIQPVVNPYVKQTPTVPPPGINLSASFEYLDTVI